MPGTSSDRFLVILVQKLKVHLVPILLGTVVMLGLIAAALFQSIDYWYVAMIFLMAMVILSMSVFKIYTENVRNIDGITGKVMKLVIV